MTPDEQVALALYRYRLEGEGKRSLPDELPADGHLRDRLINEARLAIAVYRNAVRPAPSAPTQGDLLGGAV